MAKKSKSGKKKRKAHIDHKPIVKVFASSLRDLRTARGLTQAELAVKAGINVSYVGRLERAKCAPGIDLVERLAEALGASVHDLLPGSVVDALPLLRAQVEKRIATVVKNADAATMSMLAQLLTIVDATLSKRR